MSSSILPNLRGLDDLARKNGVDIRPTLVRVLTDLYIQMPAHTIEEERHYIELAMRLLDAVDAATRAVVASKLADYPAAPAPIIRRLARDVIEVARPILERSSGLTALELIAIIKDCGPRYAAAIAARKHRDAARPRDRTKVGSSRLSDTSVPGRKAGAPARTMPPDRRNIDPPGNAKVVWESGLGDLFLAASSSERRVILANLDDDGGIPPQPAARAAEAIVRLEAAALALKPDEFGRELERALGLSFDHARRIVGDATGEPLLVATKALGMPPEIVQRILMFLNPVIGHSVPRVFDLANLYEQLTQGAALRLVASLRHVAPTQPRAPVHQPMLWNDETDGSRRAASEAARRATGAAPSSQTSPSRRDPSAPPGRRHGTM